MCIVKGLGIQGLGIISLSATISQPQRYLARTLFLAFVFVQFNLSDNHSYAYIFLYATQSLFKTRAMCYPGKDLSRSFTLLQALLQQIKILYEDLIKVSL